jgi:hypothetical protein
MESTKAENLNVLCCTYQMDATETYKKALIICMVFHIFAFLGAIANKNSVGNSWIIFLLITLISIIWAAYLLYNAPTSYLPLTQGLKTSADWFGWIQVILGWIELVFYTLFSGIIIYMIAFVKKNDVAPNPAVGPPSGTAAAAASDNSAANMFVGAAAVVLLIICAISIPLSIILIQAGKNILRVLDTVSTLQEYFQSGLPINHSGSSPQQGMAGNTPQNIVPQGKAHQL